MFTASFPLQSRPCLARFARKLSKSLLPLALLSCAPGGDSGETHGVLCENQTMQARVDADAVFVWQEYNGATYPAPSWSITAEGVLVVNCYDSAIVYWEVMR